MALSFILYIIHFIPFVFPGCFLKIALFFKVGVLNCFLLSNILPHFDIFSRRDTTNYCF